jgi:hypothetical protein
MKRGDVVAVATTGDYGKPRAAVIVKAHVHDRQHWVDDGR